MNYLNYSLVLKNYQYLITFSKERNILSDVIFIIEQNFKKITKNGLSSL